MIFLSQSQNYTTPTMADDSQFQEIWGSGTNCRGGTLHPGDYWNELFVDEIRNNASEIFQNFFSSCCKIEFVSCGKYPWVVRHSPWWISNKGSIFSFTLKSGREKWERAETDRRETGDRQETEREREREPHGLILFFALSNTHSHIPEKHVYIEKRILRYK